MFKLLKVLLVLGVLAAVGFFAFFVPLGEKTLYQHLVRIAGTDEARELGEELENKARDIGEGVAEAVPEVGSGPAEADAADADAADAGGAGQRPLGEISERDRAALRRLLAEKRRER
ncbi:MAG: hypothetical protein R6V85_13265 [Polyangia bacterium]